MTFLYLKALHLIFMVTWFAGLFYIVRLFVYQTEASQKDEPEKGILVQQFKLMSKRLWYGISWPSAILIAVFASWMLIEQPAYLKQPFMHLKLSFVIGLYAYHLYCHRLFVQLQQDKYSLSSFKLRMFNEIATVFLIAIIFIIVLRDTIGWVWGTAGILGISLALWLAIHLYRKKRKG